ncbi:hypothetical protein [Actinomycetospora termitidis]|uniref:Uncharacterized protein n=1 Tax=Actinomycetospora termitidis TaxID=3053470 RepID=A0ABT7MFN1_9PSEU|nr:hypothetical protein [Actinomycetospora sp. Odt1-22]MDL5159469.1 hypothetical protein [Actinomycetospora sp. Odt1-22]
MPVNKVRRRGSYAPLSAHYAKDDKIIRAGEKAELLYVRGLAFCADVLNDGVITDAQLAHVGVGMTALKARARALVDVELWQRVDGGYRVVAWLNWNKTREDILNDAHRDTARKSPHLHDQQERPEPPPEDDEISERNPNGIRNDRNADPDGFRPLACGPARAPSNSRAEPKPEPEPPLPSGGGSGGTADQDASPSEASRKRSAKEPRGARIPEDWWPSDDDLAWYREHCPTLAADGGRGTKLTEEFRDYWLARAGKDARKTSWSRTWRNRMRDREQQAIDQHARHRPGSPSARPSATESAVAAVSALRRNPRPGEPEQPALRVASQRGDTAPYAEAGGF